MFLRAADVAGIPGRRSRAFASITPLIVLPMKQNIHGSYKKEKILQKMVDTLVSLPCHRKCNNTLEFTIL
jgi:hypothetical protein